MSVFQWLVGSITALSAFLPQSIEGLILAAGLLTLTDTITGYAISRRTGKTTSFTMRQKLASKSQQFLTIMAMGVSGSILSRSWVPIGLSFSGILAIEFASNLENLIWLEHNGGAPLGPARPYLMRIAQALGIGLDNENIGGLETQRLIGEAEAEK